MDEYGEPIVDYQDQPIPAYENARRPRFLIQGLKPAQAECQIRMTPDGSRFYAVWNEAGTDSKTGEYSSDVMFRRIDRNHGFIVSNPLATAEP